MLDKRNGLIFHTILFIPFRHHLPKGDGTGRHNIRTILEESLEHEKQGLDLYHQLLHHSEKKSVLVEDFARKMIDEEEIHVGEIYKMLMSPETLQERYVGPWPTK
ncbi:MULTISPECIES: ferritin-like domain-containing protein [Legionella]|uniref:ferritin-like domain-containing protein n=1 Tax=Legionella TaxID=445 RepID=UPI000A7471BE|nr:MULTISPECIES: hypothetical protein [Legionella]